MLTGAFKLWQRPKDGAFIPNRYRFAFARIRTRHVQVHPLPDYGVLIPDPFVLGWF